MTNFLDAENLRASAYAECSAYITTMVSYVVASSQKYSDQFQLDVDAMFRLFYTQPQNAQMALPKYVRDLFSLIICFNFSDYYDIAHAATKDEPIYPESYSLGIKLNDLKKTARKILGTHVSSSFIAALKRNVDLLCSYGILNKVTEDASAFAQGATGHVTYVQVTPEFIKYYYEYVKGFYGNDIRTETEQGKN